MERRRSPSGKAAPGAARRAIRADDIERTILMRIARNEYRPGDRIPTCEALAAELGANKNTVSKAYRSLAARGHLLTRPGSGTTIGEKPARIDPAETTERIAELLSLAAQEAKLSGLRREDFSRLVETVAAQAFERRGPRVGFVECNRHDATILSRDLQKALATPVEPVLLDDLAADRDRYAAEYDILAVGTTHLATVEAIIGPDRPGAPRVAGVHVPIDPASLLKVARLRPGTRVGLICEMKPTLLAMTGMVGGCNPGLTVTGSLARSARDIARLAARNDVLIVTPSLAEHVHLDGTQVPIITLSFRIDDYALQELRDMVAGHGDAAFAHRPLLAQRGSR